MQLESDGGIGATEVLDGNVDGSDGLVVIFTVSIGEGPPWGELANGLLGAKLQARMTVVRQARQAKRSLRDDMLISSEHCGTKDFWTWMARIIRVNTDFFLSFDVDALTEGRGTLVSAPR